MATAIDEAVEPREFLLRRSRINAVPISTRTLTAFANRIVGGTVSDMVHSRHNSAWRESHGGKDLWVVRKGATPAFPGRIDGRRRGDR